METGKESKDKAMKARYINPYTDFGFKKLFGEEGSKDLLIDFLNHLLPQEHKIAAFILKTPKKFNNIRTDRAILDIYCEDEKGEKFIVEMQKAKIKFFKDRSLFYTTFPMKEQAEKGDWDINLKPVYCVGILDFTFDEDSEQKTYAGNVGLKDRYCRIFYDKLTYVLIEMPRFNKQENELQNRLDKWLYFWKHLEDFETIPGILKEDVFMKGFQLTEITNFDKKQLDAYEYSLKLYREFKAAIDTAYEEGLIEGIRLSQQKTHS